MLCSIINHVGADSDIRALALTCRHLYRTICSRGSPVWKIRFKHLYNSCGESDTRILEDLVRDRLRVTRQQCFFFTGDDGEERRALEIIQRLILGQCPISSSLEGRKAVHLHEAYRFCLG